MIGTTGHGEGKKLPGYPENPDGLGREFSTGVNLAFSLPRKPLKCWMLKATLIQKVIEMHHRLKKNAPSGTADSSEIARVRNLTDQDISHGREEWWGNGRIRKSAPMPCEGRCGQ